MFAFKFICNKNNNKLQKPFSWQRVYWLKLLMLPVRCGGRQRGLVFFFFFAGMTWNFKHLTKLRHNHLVIYQLLAKTKKCLPVVAMGNNGFKNKTEKAQKNLVALMLLISHSWLLMWPQFWRLENAELIYTVWRNITHSTMLLNDSFYAIANSFGMSQNT